MNNVNITSQHYATLLKKKVDTYHTIQQDKEEKIASVTAAFNLLNDTAISIIKYNDLDSIITIEEHENTYSINYKINESLECTLKTLKLEYRNVSFTLAPTEVITSGMMNPVGTLIDFTLEVDQGVRSIYDPVDRKFEPAPDYKQYLDEKYNLLYNAETSTWWVVIIPCKDGRPSPKAFEMVKEEFNNESFMRILYSVFGPLIKI